MSEQTGQWQAAQYGGGPAVATPPDERLRPEMGVFSYLDVMYAPKALLNSGLILLAALVWALANLAVPIQE